MKNLRFVTTASLFDGHDASINIIRRILQSKGVEVIHLGHNRTAHEVVDAAISEDADAIAISSYQGGHNEYFTYVRELLDAEGCQHIKIFGGGGGVITPKEIAALHKQGIEKIYHPEDGRELGLEGMIEDMISRCGKSGKKKPDYSRWDLSHLTKNQIGQLISEVEDNGSLPVKIPESSVPVLGITGTGGAGKSSLIDELLIRFRHFFPDKKLALISVDPTKKKTRGALLGDRIRLGSADHDNFYVRSLATRESRTELSPQIKKSLEVLKGCGFDLILVETSGIGQASDEITTVSDKCLYVMTPEFGAQSQLEKIEMLESANFVAINKFEKVGALDALRDVRKQFKRNHKQFNAKDEDLPVYGTIASQFNDRGVNALFVDLMSAFKFESKYFSRLHTSKHSETRSLIIPPNKVLYLRDIADTCRRYNQKTETLSKKIDKIEAYEKILEYENSGELKESWQKAKNEIEADALKSLEEFEKIANSYPTGQFTYQVRGKDIKVETQYTSLSHQKISRVSTPKYSSMVDRFKFVRNQNLPGFFPYAAGIFPFKRKDEEPKRMFAGEGGPSKTNKRFHYLSKNDKAKRLSTAFDSVTLYGEDPEERPDIYGKVGESGVSICSLQDMCDLYDGFDLISPYTSVSKTINGPAPIILAMFLNAACRQKLEGDDFWNEEKRLEIMRQVRGTVQADILKEDQAQNTCIFSLDFALKMMGDIQEFFSHNKIKNYYTVSISGYHIAEAGANPLTQLAFTLSNGFTYIEYYLSRGMKIDDFAENLSFFFSNGLDPEYTVIGRVARKIWAVTLRDKYGANLKSQKLKYHIQTSGRSLHAQEIDFNDIRTTLQAFLAISDNCNSLHTNAYDEAITTPTEESVRRAMAIQMIINREFGLNKTENPLQGSFIYDELSELVEEAVLKEFEKISDRGGVLGAMESMYQRGQIQEESLYYETLKDSGELPIIGVNTYTSENFTTSSEMEITRSSGEEKDDQINRLKAFRKTNENESGQKLDRLKEIALANGNIFEELLTTVNFCSLGQITQALYEVGGKYRRNM